MNALQSKVDELKRRLEEALAVERELSHALDQQNSALKQGRPDAIVAATVGLERVTDDLATASNSCKQLVADLDLGLHAGAQLREVLLHLPERARKDLAQARSELADARRDWLAKAERNARLARAGLDAVAEARRILDGANVHVDGNTPFSQLDATA